MTGQKSGGRYRLRRSAKAISAGHDNDRLACFLRASCTVSKPAFPVAPPVTRRKQRCRKNLMLESAKTSACDTLRHNPWSSRAPKSIPIPPSLCVFFFIHCTNLFLSQSLHSPSLTTPRSFVNHSSYLDATSCSCQVSVCSCFVLRKYFLASFCFCRDHARLEEICPWFYYHQTPPSRRIRRTIKLVVVVDAGVNSSMSHFASKAYQAGEWRGQAGLISARWPK